MFEMDLAVYPKLAWNSGLILLSKLSKELVLQATPTPHPIVMKLILKFLKISGLQFQLLSLSITMVQAMDWKLETEFRVLRKRRAV